ncbi:Squamosa promoter-binding-like protein 15 [Zea mays]|uniref:Squamosa promoter-binding-like protein 15 n=1 Tax=Zea mays TaxID=4577 RepID=A0A3L6EFK9_MAIZE|nr:Squamosa promoter-binding-like protein 15 [Zea mays]
MKRFGTLILQIMGKMLRWVTLAQIRHGWHHHLISSRIQSVPSRTDRHQILVTNPVMPQHLVQIIQIQPQTQMDRIGLLEENLLQRVNSLVQSSDLDFWRKGRFLVRTNSQLVSYKAGITCLSKSWRTWNTPELTLVSPIAVVGGQKTSLILKGHNLSIPGTQIHCTSIGKYISKEVMCSAYPGTIYDDSGVETFDLTGKPDLIIGRCFVEVENRFRGTSFSVIGGLCTLCCFEEGWKLSDMMFVTKRGLSDACNVVGKQVDQVSESVNEKKLYMQEIMDAVNNSGKFDTKFGGFTGTDGPLGKRMENSKTRAEIGWEPKYPSFTKILDISS